MTTAARVRRPAVAGAFYPDDRHALTTLVSRLMDEIEVPVDEPLALAYVTPHAGYRFSGPIAAQVYARLRAHADRVRRIVVLGPSHFVPLRGCAVPTVDSWLTPAGEAPIDTEVRAAVVDAGLAAPDDAPHSREHSIEVQLPFLSGAVGDDVALLPIAVGACPVEKVVEIAEVAMAAAGPGAVLLCSTDFSHYHDHATAQQLDRRTAQAVADLAPDRISPQDACGVFALRGAVGWARKRRLGAQQLDLRTSADTYGNPDRVVGYPAFAFHEAGSAERMNPDR